MTSYKTFRDRQQAGEMLARGMIAMRLKPPVLVLGLPRGGVPVAAEVANLLRAPLDILTVRKIGAPGHEELACGAVASGGIVVWNRGILKSLGVSERDLLDKVELEREELEKRERSIRSPETPPHSIKGHTVLIIDDGVATGATMRAAITAVQAEGPKEIVVGLPVAPQDTCRDIANVEGVRVVCLREIPGADFGSVGQWYDEFSQVETEECREALIAAARR
jgi:predicted phosphoribosyltransferase